MLPRVSRINDTAEGISLVAERVPLRVRWKMEMPNDRSNYAIFVSLMDVLRHGSPEQSRKKGSVFGGPSEDSFLLTAATVLRNNYPLFQEILGRFLSGFLANFRANR